MRAEPVLLVHGFASSFERNWREPGWVDLLSDAGREVIGLDLLGHGHSPKPHDPAAYGRLAEDILAVLPADGRVDAVGFSMGAGLVLQVAAAHPERFGRIVVAGVGANLFRTERTDEIARAIETGEAGESAAASTRAFIQFAEGEGNDRDALVACMRRPHQPLTAELAAGITCPVLVVLGDRDFAGPADLLVDALPDAELVVLRGADHFGTPRDFRFIDAALEFLDAVPS